MKIKIILFLLCAAVFPAMAQQADKIAPPSWMGGDWTFTESADGGGPGGTFTITFTLKDIVYDGESLEKLIAAGEVTAFTQKVLADSYEIYIMYPDGYWFREVFQKPAEGASSMISTFETSESGSEKCVYSRQ